MTKTFSHIQIRGAKTHNLKNIDIDIPLEKITCLVGPSGSGKTSLAFHTLFQESKRRLINSFPSDIKFFWDIPQTADVDRIEPVLPVWALAQHNPVIGSRPTLGDLMGVTERLQQVFFYLGQNHCPVHHEPFVKAKQWGSLLPKNIDAKTILHIFIGREDYKSLIRSGILPSRSFHEDIHDFNENDSWWEITRLRAGDFVESIETKLRELELERFHGSIRIIAKDGSVDVDASCGGEKSCAKCGRTQEQEISHFHHLSPYNGVGACRECDGHGMILKYDREKLVKAPEQSVRDGAVSVMNYKSFLPWHGDMLKAFKRHGLDLDVPFKKLPEKKWKLLYDGDGGYPGFNAFFEYLESKRYKTHVRILIRSLKSEFLCPSCQGTRLSRSLDGYAINTSPMIFWSATAAMSLNELHEALKTLLQKSKKLTHIEKVEKIILDVIETLETAKSLGIGGLKANAKVKGLTPGQYQRVLLSKLLSFRGSGSLFVLDEPTLGLDNDEIKKVIIALRKLRDQGNTILVVEHAPAMLEAVDEIVEMGPGAGELGGSLLYQGKPKKVGIPKFDIKPKKEFAGYIKVTQALGPEGWGFDYQLPIKAISVVTGPSEGGKRQAVLETLEQWSLGDEEVAQKVECPIEFDKVISLGAEVGRVTARATVGSFLGLTPYLRKHFSDLPVSKAMGLKDGHFSYNSDLGRCPTCEGRGTRQVDMTFMEDVLLTCDDCRGMKLRPHYALISDGHQTYHQALNRPAKECFAHIPTTAKAKRILAAMETLRLNHLSLDRTLQSLSGGERQRIKLLEQTQGRMGQSLLIFENVSFGLSSEDLLALFGHFQRLRDYGHTLILLDQHPHLQEYADYSLEIQ